MAMRVNACEFVRGGGRVEHELELECLCTSIDECEYGKE